MPLPAAAGIVSKVTASIAGAASCGWMCGTATAPAILSKGQALKVRVEVANGE
jgi:hypothetical protein